jgi:chromosome segregation ATPase
MRRRRWWGSSAPSPDEAQPEQRTAHRLAADLLRSRLAEASGRLNDLRERKAKLTAELNRLDAEAQRLLEEMNRLGAEAEGPRQAQLARHRRAEQEMQAAIALLEQERAAWVELEGRIAEGVLGAVQPYLEINAVQPIVDEPALAPAPVPAPAAGPPAAKGG